MSNPKSITNKLKRKYLNKINSYEKIYEKLSDEELQMKSSEFKERIKESKNQEKELDKLLPEAFALVREASKRVLGKRLFDVQMLAGIALHNGCIAEQKTGEGKTLTAVLPTYLNALTGKGVHVVTVNDYLAKVGEENLRPLYEFLGLTTAVILENSNQIERKESYKKDVCYITNSELGFDYLRDNMVFDKNDKVQRPFNFCIVDEADSILIDEARTPLIISRPSNKPTDMYRAVDMFVKLLKPEDYEVDKKLGIVNLTETGIEKAERILSLKNYSDIENNVIRHHVTQALKANYDMQKDKEYIVKDGEIVIIDEFTGRIAEGRRYSKGLHQAIEAKEGLKIKEESVTLATITYQNFFKLYPKFSGMTGTAVTEKKEFKETYEKNVALIPTNKPVIRKDKEDIVFFTEKAKNKAIIEDIKENYKVGRPVLIGTPSIEKSEQLSDLLKKENIPHQVLNAKYHDIEAEIVARAGQKYAVTIATNMAGRGTDIELGEGVKELGGLKVIGTERAENRRVDNQLMGRAGRQGDNGESQFYLSFEDSLMNYASEHSKAKLTNIPIDDDAPVQSKFLSSIIKKSQDNRTNQNFDSRHNTLKYDEILNKQRILMYEKRDELLAKQNGEKIVLDGLDAVIQYNAHNIKDFEILKKKLKRDFMLKQDINVDTVPEIKTYLLELYKGNPFIKDNELKEQYLRKVILTIMDDFWINYLTEIEDLRQDVKLIGYRGEDPIHLFTTKACELFNDMSNQIRINILITILNYDKEEFSNEKSD